jgi:hypothetical protein
VALQDNSIVIMSHALGLVKSLLAAVSSGLIDQQAGLYSVDIEILATLFLLFGFWDSRLS